SRRFGARGCRCARRNHWCDSAGGTHADRPHSAQGTVPTCARRGRSVPHPRARPDATPPHQLPNGLTRARIATSKHNCTILTPAFEGHGTPPLLNNVVGRRRDVHASAHQNGQSVVFAVPREGRELAEYLLSQRDLPDIERSRLGLLEEKHDPGTVGQLDAI